MLHFKIVASQNFMLVTGHVFVHCITCYCLITIRKISFLLHMPVISLSDPVVTHSFACRVSSGLTTALACLDNNIGLLCLSIDGTYNPALFVEKPDFISSSGMIE